MPYVRLCCLSALLFTGCVGTDEITDPPMIVPPRVVIGAGSLALQVGDETEWAAVYFDDMGTLVTGAAFIWSTTDPGIATVSPSGRVTGVSEGQVLVVASVGAVGDSLLLAIVADASMQTAMVRLSPEEAILQPGESVQFTARSLNADGEPLESGSVSWTSSDPDVATIDTDGTVTAVSSGQASIRAETDGIISSAVQITVPGAGRSGTFVQRPGTSYNCAGMALLESGGDGLVLTFGDDFLVSAGPRLGVFLSTSNAVGPGSINIG